MNIKRTLTAAFFLLSIISFSSAYAFEVTNQTNTQITVASPDFGVFFLKHLKRNESVSWHYRGKPSITLTFCWFGRAVCDKTVVRSASQNFKNDATITVTGTCHIEKRCLPSKDLCFLKRNTCKESMTVSS